MLHRMTMRVVPALTVAVTEEQFRKRKQLLMLFPGLFAFALYRGLQALSWHNDPLALLLASGLFSSFVACVAYAYGRECRVVDLMRTEDWENLGWIAFRIGFLYAVQLSLMVLALLKVATYSYSEHPDGPAMMALIIASTSVARDAFEIGRPHLLPPQGRNFASFPCWKALWRLLGAGDPHWVRHVASATCGVGLIYFGVTAMAPILKTDLGQLGVIGILSGFACTLGFVQGLRPAATAWNSLGQYSWRELLRFFLWPGMTFGWTYFLIVLGAFNFVLASPTPTAWAGALIAAGIGGLMNLCGYYLGWSRWQEERQHATIPPSLLRCPFILGVLTSKKA